MGLSVLVGGLTWRLAVTEASNECFGRQPTCRGIAVQVQAEKDQGRSVATERLEEWRWLARIRGEDGGDEMSREESIGLPPKEATEAVRAIDRGKESARRIDTFCREVAKTGRVFFAWELNDKVLAILRAPEARAVWSSKGLAESALSRAHGPEWATKYIEQGADGGLLDVTLAEQFCGLKPERLRDGHERRDARREGHAGRSPVSRGSAAKAPTAPRDRRASGRAPGGADAPPHRVTCTRA